MNVAGNVGTPDFLSGGGEMGALMRAHDWSASTLGHLSGWPQALRTAVRLLLNTGHPMYIWWGATGACLYNDAYRQSIGPERHPGSLGRPARDVWDEIWDIIGPQIKQVMSGRGATWHENHLVPITRNGRREDVYWTYSYSPIDDETAPNGIGGVLVVCSETTRLVQSGQRLVEEIGRQRGLLQRAPGFFAVLDGPDHVYSFVNDAYVQLVGEREFVGKAVHVAMPELEGQGFAALLDRVYQTGERFVARKLPVRLQRRPDGPSEVRILDFVYEPVADDAGRITGIFIAGTDTTEQHHAEAALQSLNESLEARVAERTRERDGILARLRSIFETSYQFQGLLALDGTLLDANATSLAAIACRLEDVTGRPFCRTPWFAGTPGMEELVRRGIAAAAAGQSVRREIRVYLPVGGWRWFEFALRPMRDGDGQVIAIVPEAIEVTERKQAEEALHQSQKLEAMGQLMGGVAHDFNNLLTPIIGGLDMLQRRGVGGERERRLIDSALQSADRAKTLVHRLLAFARRQPLQPVPVDVGALVEGMAALVASTSGPQIKLVVDLAPDLPTATADANQLEMALLNLSVNARDAMPDGGTLSISVAAETIGNGPRVPLVPGDYVRLTVADTGAGMDEATLAHAIEPFFSTKGIGKGTGLGLSMVHGLASQLGGALLISSQPGLGTAVELWLPVAQTRPSDAEAAPEKELRQTAGTVLLVDDDDMARLSTAEMLIDLGYEVREVQSAAEALAIIDGGAPVDVLVTDHLMPGMTGVDLAYAVRQRRPGLPLLIVSGFAEAEAIAPDLPRLTKPFRQAELAAMLEGINPPEPTP